jgi:hypothetical protein
VFVGCAEPPPAPPTGPIGNTDGLELSWSVQRLADRMQIDYVLHNRGDAGVWVLDTLVEAGRALPEAVVVRSGPASTVLFTKGYVEPPDYIKFESPPLPAARHLPAGRSIAGRAWVNLPLRAWSNVTPVPPLEPSSAYAILEVGYSTKLSDRNLVEVEFDGATRAFPISSIIDQQLVRGEALALPPGASPWIPYPPSRAWLWEREMAARIHTPLRSRP